VAATDRLHRIAANPNNALSSFVAAEGLSGTALFSTMNFAPFGQLVAQGQKGTAEPPRPTLKIR